MFKALLFISLLALYPAAAKAEDLGGLKIAESLEENSMDDTAFTVWREVALCKALTLTPDGYKDELKAASKNFTKEGWEAFMSALLKSKILDKMAEYKSAIAPETCTGASLFLRDFTDNRLRWVYEIQLRMQYATADIPPFDRLLKFTIVRTPKGENPDGVGIAEWAWRDTSQIPQTIIE